MSEKSYDKIIALNSVQQNEMMVWHCLENSDMVRFKQLLKSGMPLSPFMLTSMVFFDFSDTAIKEVLALGKITDNAAEIISWMRSYFTVDALAIILPIFDEYLPDDYPSDEDCVRLRLWETLYRRKKYTLVAKKCPGVFIAKRHYSGV